MLSLIALVWGILAIIGMGVGFIPSLAAWSWVQIFLSRCLARVWELPLSLLARIGARSSP